MWDALGATLIFMISLYIAAVVHSKIFISTLPASVSHVYGLHIGVKIAKHIFEV